MKKILSFSLCVVMLCSIAVPSFASEPQAETKEITTDGYTFEITESTAADYSVTRSYVNPSYDTRSVMSNEEVAALLLSLGFSDRQLAEMSDEEFRAFADAKDIFVTTSYIKHNEKTNVTTALPEDVALQEAEALEKKQDEYYLNPQNPIVPFGVIDSDVQINGVFEDSYMRVTQAANHRGGGDYTFVTDALWLTMPRFRAYDSIGSCYNEGSTEPYHATGYYTFYTEVVKNNQVVGKPTHSGRQKLSKIEDLANHGWHGSAGTFCLPPDLAEEGSDVVTRRKDVFAHFEYNCSVRHPELVTNFNVNGSYYHVKYKLEVNPALAINMDGRHISAGVTGGPSITRVIDKRIAPLQVKYTP